MNAFILVNAERGKVWKVAEEILRVDGIKIAHAVAGPYDVITYSEFTRIEGLGRIIDKIQSIDGVIRTTTAIAIVPGP